MTNIIYSWSSDYHLLTKQVSSRWAWRNLMKNMSVYLFTGHYCSSTGAWQPVRCNSGTYQDQTGQGTCKTCPAGFFCDNTLAPVVLFNSTICPVGRYQTTLFFSKFFEELFVMWTSTFTCSIAARYALYCVVSLLQVTIAQAEQSTLLNTLASQAVTVIWQVFRLVQTAHLALVVIIATNQHKLTTLWFVMQGKEFDTFYHSHFDWFYSRQGIFDEL